MFRASNVFLSRIRKRCDQWICIGLIVGTVSGCQSQISFEVQVPAEFQIEDIEYLAIGSIEAGSGRISLPSLRQNDSFSSKLNLTDGILLEPSVQGFDSNQEHSRMCADLLRAQLLGLLSTNSSWTLINTTGKEMGFSGSIPEDTRVAVLDGRVKYAEIRHEGRELLNYFVSVENKGTTFEQQLLAKAGSLGAESLGAGFEIPTPYIELFAAIEVELTLKKRSGELLVPPQIHRAYYVRKWGGGAGSSHMLWKLRSQIINDFQQDESLSEILISDLESTTLALQDPAAYLSRGLNLKKNPQVPLTSLDLMIRLSRETAERYMKQVSPYQESTVLDIQAGNDVAVNLIQGNAYQEAIAYLQGLEERSTEDEYNLGLAYEASGVIRSARIHFEIALQKEPRNALILKALNRLK